MRETTSLIAGRRARAGEARSIRSPFDNSEVTQALFADQALLEKAIQTAWEARHAAGRIPPYERVAILEHYADAVAGEREELALILRDEAGKPIALARIEADRCVDTIRDAAHWARQMQDELIPLDGGPTGANRHGIVKRFPRGLVSAITPFNFPLNLVAHKIAPAIAAGCPMVLKPASQTPSMAVRLAELALAAGWPAEALQVVLVSGPDAELLVTDDRPAMITFTGSPDVGWDLKARCGHKTISLELGGNAAGIVAEDADWEKAAKRLAVCAYGYAGQSCISVQRIYIHRSLEKPFTEALVAAAKAIPFGDPSRDETLCGPLIDDANAERVMNWIAEAVGRGGHVLCGNTREGNVISPTLVAEVPDDVPLSCREVFGPVATIDTYEDFDSVLARVNDSRYGLQAGIYTNDFRRIWKAFTTLEVGGVVHNDAPTFRIDAMPYGGVKWSGLGREGARYAIHEMTEPRLLLLETRED